MDKSTKPSEGSIEGAPIAKDDMVEMQHPRFLTPRPFLDDRIMERFRELTAGDTRGAPIESLTNTHVELEWLLALARDVLLNDPDAEQSLRKWIALRGTGTLIEPPKSSPGNTVPVDLATSLTKLDETFSVSALVDLLGALTFIGLDESGLAAKGIATVRPYLAAAAQIMSLVTSLTRDSSEPGQPTALRWALASVEPTGDACPDVDAQEISLIAAWDELTKTWQSGNPIVSLHQSTAAPDANQAITSINPSDVAPCGEVSLIASVDKPFPAADGYQVLVGQFAARADILIWSPLSITVRVPDTALDGHIWIARVADYGQVVRPETERWQGLLGPIYDRTVLSKWAAAGGIPRPWCNDAAENHIHLMPAPEIASVQLLDADGLAIEKGSTRRPAVVAWRVVSPERFPAKVTVTVDGQPLAKALGPYGRLVLRAVQKAISVTATNAGGSRSWSWTPDAPVPAGSVGFGVDDLVISTPTRRHLLGLWFYDEHGQSLSGPRQDVHLQLTCDPPDLITFVDPNPVLPMGTGFLWVYVNATRSSSDPDFPAAGRPCGTVLVSITDDSGVTGSAASLWLVPSGGYWRVVPDNPTWLRHVRDFSSDTAFEAPGDTDVIALPNAAIHAALLPTNRVMFFGPLIEHHRQDVDPADLVSISFWDVEHPLDPPVRGTMPSPRNLFCVGQSYLEDGRLLMTGGQAYNPFQNPGIGFVTILTLGLTLAAGRGSDHDVHVFDPYSGGVNGTWTRFEDMRDARWYPTQTTLPSGHVLLLAGSMGGAYTGRININQWRYWASCDWDIFLDRLMPYGDPWPERHFMDDNMDTYPFVQVLPGGLLLVTVHNWSRLVEFNLSRRRPSRASARKYSMATRHQNRTYPEYGSAVLLSLEPPYDRARVLVVGGGTDYPDVTPGDDEPGNATGEIFDFHRDRGLEDQPGWRGRHDSPTITLNNPRVLAEATMLADGKVLISNGCRRGYTNYNQDPVLEAEIFDPYEVGYENVVSAATAHMERRYHSVSLLLADGRVLTAGSTGHTMPPQLNEVQWALEMYEPEYMFHPRPRITEITAITPALPPGVSSAAPAGGGEPGRVAPTGGLSPDVHANRSRIETQVSYGQMLRISYDSAPNGVDEVALVRLSTATHANHMDARRVVVSFTIAAPNAVYAQIPADPTVLPPGPYMVFVLKGGIPSEGKFILVRRFYTGG